MSTQPTTPAPRSRVLAASCDKHLANLILGTLPGPEAPPADVRVVELREARTDSTCSCGVPAQWLVRTHGLPNA